jgi:hypothetical protein
VFCHGAVGIFPELNKYKEVSTYAVHVKNELSSAWMHCRATLIAAQIKAS